MNPKSPKSKPSLVAWSIAAALFLCIFAVAILSNKPEMQRPPGRDASAGTNSPVVSPTGTSARTDVAAPPVSPPFQLRPFARAQSGDVYDWTAEDGRDTNVIRRLAHNELEYQRMADENGRIYRRQLVYLKERADLMVQRAKSTGTAIRQLVLPALDGQEVRCEINGTDLSPSGQQGTFSGHIAGDLDSMVTFAFKGGREAFTILSPKTGLYLVGEPREPGELIVKSINPDTYVVGVCGNPDK